MLFRHRNCIREPGHLYTAHGIIGSQNLLLVHDLAPAPELHHLLFLWSPGSHLNSLNKTGTRERESLIRETGNCISEKSDSNGQMRVSYDTRYDVIHGALLQATLKLSLEFILLDCCSTVKTGTVVKR